MNLNRKKELAARTFNVGKKRIIFVKERLDEIKDAITKQDIRDLKQDNAIMIKEIKGRHKIKKKKRKKGAGKVRKKLRNRKKNYVKITRKLRNYVKELKNQGKLSLDEFKDLRKRIRDGKFKSKKNLKNYIMGFKK
jgi:large subunit ribosomal protein L19e